MKSKLYKAFYKLKRRLFAGMFVFTLGFGSPSLSKVKEELEKAENARHDGDLSQRKGAKETNERFEKNEIHTTV